MKVSICIPTYNQAPFLEQAVRSAAQQTLVPIEIIVADDCSTDNTQELLKKLSAEIRFLKVIRQPQNKGITYNTNTCLRAAKGDVIIRLDSDDYLASDYTKKLAEQLGKHPEAGYVHAAVQEIDQYGSFLKLRKLARKSGFQTGEDALKAAVKGYRVAANIIMFRRSALMKVGFISAQTNFAEDYHLSASLAAAGYGNVYLNDVLSFYRVWIDTGKVRQRRKLAEVIGLRKVFEEVLEPAYQKRGWQLQELKSAKASFACRHADCLGWNIYSKIEKEELKIELNKLSSSIQLKLTIYMYLHGFGALLDIKKRAHSWPKSVLKMAYLKLRMQY